MDIGSAFESDPQSIGPTSLDYMYRVLGIDAEWCVRSDRSIVWWPHTYRQSLIADLPFVEDDGTLLTPITCSTEALASMPESPALYHTLSMLNYHLPLSCLAFDPDTREVRSLSRVYLHSENSWLIFVLQAAAGIQLAQVERLGPYWEEKLGGRIVNSPHPKSGLRSTPDELVNGVHALFARDGSTDNPFSGLLPGVDALHEHPWSTLDCSDERLVAEVPFRDSIPMSVVARNEPVGTKALLRMNADKKHPELGYGLAGDLELPLRGDATTGAVIANTFNLLESQGAVRLTQFLGAWSFKESLAFRFFIPALLGRNHDPEGRTQLIHTLMSYMTNRARGAHILIETARIRAHRQFPQLSDLTNDLGPASDRS
jgi:hypothetical protein